MADSKPAKPGVSRLRKWGGRFALVSLLFVLAVMVWISGGRKVVGGIVLDWARGRLERQLEESRAQLPEIADYEALLRKEVNGTNGWEHVEAGCKATREIELRHRSDRENVFSVSSIGDFADAWQAEAYGAKSDGIGSIRPAKFALVLSETATLSAHAERASKCDCIVNIETNSEFLTSKKNGRNKWENMVSPHDFIGVLITRVRLLALTGDAARANDEVWVLVMLASKLNVRLSKQKAIDNIRSRSDVLEFGVLPLLKTGMLDVNTKQALLAARWRSPGKDAELWLNNAADAYDHLRYGLEHDIEMYFGVGDDSPFLEARFVLANADWMAVATKNALAARAGELDLRDENWVEHYNAQYDTEFALVNGVVPCGRETMSWLVREVKREDKLWAEIETLAK